MPARQTLLPLPPEILALQRQRRMRTLRLYGIVIAGAVLLGVGFLVIYGAYIQAGVTARNHIGVAEAYLAHGNPSGAEREVRAAVAAKDDYVTRLDLGIVLLKEGRYTAALAQLQQAEADANQATAYFYAGMADLALRRWSLARDQAQRGLAIVPADPDLTAVLATADRGLGHTARASGEFATARAGGYSGQTIQEWIAEARLEQDSSAGGGGGGS